MLAACAEHWAELRWAPGLKVAAVSWAGLAAVVAGELLRKAAMVRARLCVLACRLHTGLLAVRCGRQAAAAAANSVAGACGRVLLAPCHP